MEKITDLLAYERKIMNTGVHVELFLIDERNSIYSVWIDFEYSHKIQLIKLSFV